jgi:hypothetical protein
MVTLHNKSKAERLVDELPELPPNLRVSLLRRKSRRERLAAQLEDFPVARVALIAAATAVVVGVAYLARKKLFVAASVVADVVEEVADTVEDAAEDLGDAARERAETD